MPTERTGGEAGSAAPLGGRAFSTVLLTAPYGAADLERIRRAVAPAELVVVDRHDDAGIAAALERAEVALLASDLDDRFLAAPRLAWVHCGHAGIEASARPELLQRGVLVTGSAGRSSPVLAEHVFFLMLSLVYDSPGLLRAQAEHRWGLTGYEQRRGLFGKTVGLVGLGGTGSEVARRARPFEMRVLGYRRRPVAVEGVERVYAADEGEPLDELLSASDFVVACVSLSDSTRHLLGAREFGLMQQSAYFINIARGDVVDEAALLAALQSGRIAGAGLDNFATEPLPAESPFWELPNVVITPHSTPQMPDRTERTLRILLENIARFRDGEPLLNALTARDGYSHHR